MKRVELRRQAKAEKKKKATYNFNEEQLQIMIKKGVDNEIEQIKKEAMGEAINQAMVLLMAIPMEVLMDHYWIDDYAEKIPEFTNYILDYYDSWQKGEISLEALRDDLWEYGGVRFEETEG